MAKSACQSLLLVLLWDQEETATAYQVLEGRVFHDLEIFCLESASKCLHAESFNAPTGVRPARYVFTELLRSDREFDSETRAASHKIQDLLKRATILASYSLLPSSRDFAPNLCIIHIFSAGVDLITDHPLVRDAGLDVTTSKGIHGVPIAEWVAMTILAHRKKLFLAYDLQKRHQWPRDKTIFSQLGSMSDITVGILGYGSIGRQIARVLSGFGCEIVVHTASPRADASSRRDLGYVLPGTGDIEGCIPTRWSGGMHKSSLHEFLLQKMEVLVLALPITPSTNHLLSHTEFNVLAKSHADSHDGCFLINVSRGGLVDQPALVAALNDGRLSGAALDVATPEPLDADNALWDAKNVILTPHISALGPEYLRNALNVLATNLSRLEKGQSPFNLFDRTRGY